VAAFALATKLLEHREPTIALERVGDREALRDHVRSFGCKLIYAKVFDLFEPERAKRIKPPRRRLFQVPQGRLHGGAHVAAAQLRRDALEELAAFRSTGRLEPPRRPAAGYRTGRAAWLRRRA
jgi:hypothetical protein